MTHQPQRSSICIIRHRTPAHSLVGEVRGDGGQMASQDIATRSELYFWKTKTFAKVNTPCLQRKRLTLQGQTTQGFVCSLLPWRHVGLYMSCRFPFDYYYHVY
ncbi:hypothetical protein GDO81_019403 [Engystomops pustulosus]|uniref:Uncharacterized protein n=1 Tax=Engystomops pustulosus TaxID=76066 RepID=A0AAV6ZAN6_ENGPU|nr:hypothetical protein GDO81_019403 [Engystomops pustulosus]